MFVPVVSGLVGMFLVSASGLSKASGADAVMEVLDQIRWYGHDTFRIDLGKVVYTDPFKVKHSDTADIILVSHEHFDHCSTEDIAKLSSSDTVVVAPKQCRECLDNLGCKVVYMEPGGITNVHGVQVTAVSAYNINKSFHPKEKGGLGFVVSGKGVRVYLAGDTDRIPEMKDLDVDIALLPVSGTYVMDVEEAVAAVEDIKPRYVIPMHYGSIVGTKDDGSRFAELVKGKAEVKVLEPY